MPYPSFFKPTKRRSKYNATHTQYGGSLYDSRREAEYAASLDIRKRAVNPAERVVKWERQVKTPLVVNGMLVTTWYCDFRVWFADGREEWHEVKGLATPEFKMKEKLFRALYPDRRLIVIH